MILWFANILTTNKISLTVLHWPKTFCACENIGDYQYLMTFILVKYISLVHTYFIQSNCLKTHPAGVSLKTKSQSRVIENIERNKSAVSRLQILPF
jgi:hypothetical protein